MFVNPTYANGVSIALLGWLRRIDAAEYARIGAKVKLIQATHNPVLDASCRVIESREIRDRCHRPRRVALTKTRAALHDKCEKRLNNSVFRTKRA
jgi:hypothetical protein